MYIYIYIYIFIFEGTNGDHLLKGVTFYLSIYLYLSIHIYIYIFSLDRPARGRVLGHDRGPRGLDEGDGLLSVHAFIDMYIYIYIYIYTHIHTYIYIYIHIYIYIMYICLCSYFLIDEGDGLLFICL